MKTYYIRMKSNRDIVCEVEKLNVEDGMTAFWNCGRVAQDWGTANGSEAVRWWVEDSSGRQIGRGQWVRPEANARVNG